MVIKKANDIGTDKVVLQTMIGMDGDVTTRIEKAFADKPVTFINEMHQQALGIPLDRHCKRAGTACHKEKVKISRFSYLKISASKHLIKCYKLTLIF